MFPILYEQITPGTVPQNNGLGILSDCISCEVEQERNGIYELVMEYPMTGKLAEEIAWRRIIKVKPNFTDNPQLFRIDRIGKVLNGRFTVFAKHISYDLSGYEITTGTASSATAAAALLDDKAPGYTITTNKTTTGSFSIDTPGSVRSYFAGREGSFLDVYGTAEIKYDNFNINFMQNAGQDRGETIQYGKNLLELSQEIDCSNLYTHVQAFYKGQDTAAVIGSKISTGLTLDAPKTLMLDLSQEYQEAPTAAALTQKAQDYISNNNLTVPSNNIKLDFVQSGELTGRVDLCDIVSIKYEALGITRTQMKCIRTKWDCIREKYIETEFGDAKTNLADTIATNNQAIKNKPSRSYLEEAVTRATKLITGNLGGYVILHDSNGDGEPDEILIMDEPDINDATKVWRWNKNGLGYSGSGYSGTFGLAMTAEGEIVADFVTAGSMSGNRIRSGLIVSEDGQLIMDLDNGTITAPAITLNGSDIETTLDELVQTSIVTKYALSNSGTVIPSTWPLSDPTEPTASQPYLWTKTEYTYANGQTNTSYGISVRGAKGQNGADGAGLNILGNYNSMADLIAAHPTGSAGDAYMIGTDLAVWNTTTNSWENVGRIQGPSGADGLWLTITNDDTGSNSNITYTAHLMQGTTTDITTTANAIFTWQLVKETGITELASNAQSITVARDAADYGATIRCICVAITSEEDLEDYSYNAISDYSGNNIQIIGQNNIQLFGDTAIYKPSAISAQFQVLSDQISSKVEQTTFNSLAGTVSSQGTAIEQNAEQIVLKADASTVSTQLNGKMATDMSNRSSSITINSGEIKFESNTVSISATNLTVTKSGQVTAVGFKAKDSFYLVDGNGTSRGYLAYNSVGGTSFGEYTQSGKIAAVISAADGDGGQLRLYNPSGQQTANIDGNSGLFHLFNSTGNNIFDCGLNTASYNGGFIRIRNSSGSGRAIIQIASGGGGYLGLYNSDGSGQSIYENGTSGTITCVSCVQTSSRKVKENIQKMEPEEAKRILKLEAVSFDYKNKDQGTDKRGFIAEDVAEILPNLVTPETEETNATLDYIGMIPYLQTIIKEQEKRIQAIEEKLNAIIEKKETK